jgi:DNA-binding PadR family transcriptional regulator
MARPLNSSAQTRDLVAALLLRPEEWRHGYDLSTETGLKSGTLYPILMRLEAQGWLETRWEEQPTPGRPARHLYRLQPDRIGAARLAFAPPASVSSSARLAVIPEIA